MERFTESVASMVEGIGSNEKIHLGYVAAIYAVSIIIVSHVNTRRSLGSPSPLPPLSWNYVRACHYSLMIPLIVGSLLLDQFWPSNVYLVAFKAMANSYAIGSLDYIFSQTRKASALACAGGSLLWLSSSFMVQMYLLRNVFGGDASMVRQTSYTPWAFALEWLRTGHYLSLAGIFTDLVFSPMHRLTHHPLIYKRLHKGHHATTTQLSGLELWRGHALDDIIMAATIIVGFSATMVICTRLGLGYAFNPLSNTAWYIYQVYLPYSHASDSRLAALIAPMPEALNFAAYHHVHHQDPSKNYGLTLPSDLLWDTLLGARTIVMPSEFAKRKGG